MKRPGLIALILAIFACGEALAEQSVAGARTCAGLSALVDLATIRDRNGTNLTLSDQLVVLKRSIASSESQLGAEQKALAGAAARHDANLVAYETLTVSHLRETILRDREMVSEITPVVNRNETSLASLRATTAKFWCQAATSATPSKHGASPNLGAPSNVVSAGPTAPAITSSACRGFIGRWRTGQGRLLDINWAPFGATSQDMNKVRGAIGGSPTMHPDFLIGGNVAGSTLSGTWTTWSPTMTQGTFKFALASDGRTFQGQAITANGSSSPSSGTCLGPPGGTVVGAGTLDLSGNWTSHIQNDATYRDYEAVLSGPPGGPWRMTRTLYATNDSNWAMRIDGKDTDCTLFPLGGVPRGFGPNGSTAAGAPITSIVSLNGFRYDCQGVENGSPYHRASDGVLINGKITGTGWELHH
jgi:hypothetical protein